MKITEFDIEKNEEIVRDADEKEIVYFEQIKNDSKKRRDELTDKENDKKSILEKLGITEEEANILFS